MKTRLILFILLFISGFAIAGCKQQNQYRPDAKIVAAFNNKYPQSDKVEWEQSRGIMSQNSGKTVSNTRLGSTEPVNG